MAAERPRSERELLAEVRRRAARRRTRRNRRALVAAFGVLAVALAVVIPLGVLQAGGGQSVRVVEPAGAPTSAAPTTTLPAAPDTTSPTTLASTTVPAPSTTVPATATTAPSTTLPAPVTTVGVPSTAPAAPATTVLVPGESTLPRTAQLSVVACQTQMGIAGQAPAPLPSTVTVAASPDEASQLAVYSDGLGKLMVVAPAGWQCSAIDAADGSANVDVYPAGESSLPSELERSNSLPAGSPEEAVTASETSACSGCTLGQACPLFSDAATAFQSQFGRPCPTTKPAAEALYHYDVGHYGVGPSDVGPAVLGFGDPPGVAGDGSPSGGADPATGLVTYEPGNPDGSWKETCTLPQGQQDLCTAALDDFLSRYGTR